MAATATITGSPQQEAVWEAVAMGDSNVLVSARAGTGKTFTLVEALRRIDPGLRCLLLAFNKHIAQELQRRVPAGVEASTLHGLGWSVVRKALNYQGDPDAYKLEKMSREADRGIPRMFQEAAVRLARLAKYTRTTADVGMREIIVRYGIEHQGRIELLIGWSRGLVQHSRERRVTLDFDDMIDLPIALNLPLPRYDLVLVDEAQDLSLLQQELACRLAEGGRLLVCGDPYQAIYGFTGADSEALPRLGRRLEGEFVGLEEYPLTLTRRCPRAVVELARGLVPDFEALPDAPDGEVRTLPATETLAAAARPGDLVVARVNGELVSAAFALIAAGVPTLIRGRDLGKGLWSLVERLKPEGLGDLRRQLDEWQARELAKLSEQEAPAEALLAVTDKHLCLAVLIGGATSLDHLQRLIGDLFSDGGDAGKVCCSSIHRAKGLEADNVFVLAPDLLPHPRAEQPWEARQERNLAYVAATRARRRLTFCGRIPALFGWRGLTCGRCGGFGLLDERGRGADEGTRCPACKGPDIDGIARVPGTIPEGIKFGGVDRRPLVQPPTEAERVAAAAVDATPAETSGAVQWYANAPACQRCNKPLVTYRDDPAWRCFAKGCHYALCEHCGAATESAFISRCLSCEAKERAR